MAVVFDAASESHTGTSGNTSSASFTWNHAGGASARGALVYVFSALSATNPVTSVTYGGVAMTEVPYNASCTSSEAGSVKAYYLDNCGTGTKAVVVNRTNNSTIMYAVCYTVTSGGGTEVYLAGVKTKAGSATEATAASSTSSATASSWFSMALTDNSPGTGSMRFMGIWGGQASVVTALTDCNTGPSIDFGNYTISTVYGNSIQGAVTLEVTSSISDDLAVVGLTVRETAAGNNKNYSAVLTGGGVLTSVRVKGAKSDGDATGGGVFTLNYARSAKAATYSAVLTGGGVLTSVRVKGAIRAQALTGGGVLVPAVRKGAASDGDATGGGVVSLSDRKGGQSSAILKGGGVATIAMRHGGQTQIVVTGGGVLSIQAAHGAKASIALTGGGIATIDGVKAGGGVDNRNAIANLTGGGIATITFRGAHQSSPAATGGGVVTPVTRKGAVRTTTATGGGVVVPFTRKGGVTDGDATGGGVVSPSTRKGAIRAATATGGGVSSQSTRKGALTDGDATGGGIVTIDAFATGSTDNRNASVALTGGGVVTPSIKTGRTAVITITGGGVFVLTYESTGEAAQPIVLDVNVATMDDGAGPNRRAKGKTPFDDWTLAMDDEAILELYLLGKTR